MHDNIVIRRTKRMGMAISIFENINSKSVKYEIRRGQAGGHTQLLSVHEDYFAVFDLAPDASVVVYRSRSPHVEPQDSTYDIITGSRFDAVQRRGLLLRKIVDCPIEDVAMKDRLVLAGEHGARLITPCITNELWRPQ